MTYCAWELSNEFLLCLNHLSVLDKHFVYVMLLFVSKICSDFCLPLAGGLQKTAIQLLRYSQVRNFGGKMCLFDYHKHVLHFNHRYFQKFNHNCVQIAPLDLSQKTFLYFFNNWQINNFAFSKASPSRHLLESTVQVSNRNIKTLCEICSNFKAHSQVWDNIW